MVQYTIFKTALLYLLKVFFCLYEHQQETKVPFVAIFGTFSQKKDRNQPKEMIKLQFHLL